MSMSDGVKRSAPETPVSPLPPFPIASWRHAVDRAAAALDTEGIAPFGFELTGAKSFLTGHLRYLFAYIRRTPSLPSPALLGARFLGLIAVSDPELARSVEVVDCERHAVDTGASGAYRTLIIRSVNAPARLLLTWARYIIATAYPCNRGRIKAVTDFESDLMSQRYCCQLATIHDALFAELPEAPRLELDGLIGPHLRDLQAVSLAMRYRFDLVDSERAGRINAGIGRYYAQLARHAALADMAGRPMGVPDFHGDRTLDFYENPDTTRLIDTALDRFERYPAVT
jgi:hypothetical protein